MDNFTLWSLRLGFSAKNAARIKQAGIKKFLEQSFAAKYDSTLPQFLKDDPKTIQDINEWNKLGRTYTEEQRKQRLDNTLLKLVLLKAWWISKMVDDPYPLREKMTCLLQNHFVVNSRKVKNNYWLYQHNTLLREHAFGNFKDLVKKMVKSNAMINYLDNNANRKNKVNENLSRELLELFTIGIGNYKESDIVNGARALAGLNYGDSSGEYTKSEDNSEKIYFGRRGNFKSDDIVDIIFAQPGAPYLFTRKVLSWFIYDTPPENLVKYYGDYFRQQNFEIKPLLVKIFSEEFDKDSAGSKIKDPLVYILQLAEETGLKPNPILVANFLRSQGMDLYGQPNVKGWPGGYSWLTTQVYLNRNKTADRFCKGYNFPVNPLKNYQGYIDGYYNDAEFKPVLEWDNKSTGNKKIIDDLKGRLLFEADATLQKNFEALLKYDFDPKSPNAGQAVMRLFNYIVKTPEFQLV